MVGHIANHPVSIADRRIDDPLSPRVARIVTARSADTLRAVNHRKDASRLEQDGVRGTRRRENVNAGGAVRAGEGVDLRVDAVRALFLVRGRGLVGRFRRFGGFGGIGRISAVRCYAILGSGRGDDAGVRA